jgi:hypothetical protein
MIRRHAEAHQAVGRRQAIEQRSIPAGRRCPRLAAPPALREQRRSGVEAGRTGADDGDPQRTVGIGGARRDPAASCVRIQRPAPDSGSGTPAYLGFVDLQLPAQLAERPVDRVVARQEAEHRPLAHADLGLQARSAALRGSRASPCAIAWTAPLRFLARTWTRARLRWQSGMVELRLDGVLAEAQPFLHLPLVARDAVAQERVGD